MIRTSSQGPEDRKTWGGRRKERKEGRTQNELTEEGRCGEKVKMKGRKGGEGM